MKYPERKPLRLKNYDYSTPGAYFVTTCTAGKKCVLSTVVGDGLARPVVKLTNIGYIVERQIEDIPQRFPSVTVDKYVIMPNHIHLLLSIHRDAEQAIQEKAGRTSPSPTVGDVIRVLKSMSTRQARPYGSNGPLFQRFFYDHIIRNEQDYGEIWAYIEENPFRWTEDSLFATE